MIHLEDLLEKLCKLSDMDLMVLSCFNTEEPIAFKDLKEKLAFNHATVQRARKKLVKDGLIREENYYFILDGKILVRKPTQGREKAYLLDKDLQPVERLLYLLFVSSKIHNNILGFIRELFPYQGQPATDPRAKVTVMRQRIEAITHPLSDYESRLEDLEFELEDWLDLLDYGEKRSRLRDIWFKFKGTGIEDWRILTEALKERKRSKDNIISASKGDE